MVFLHDKFNGALDRKISSKEIWNHLTDMYDLNSLVSFLPDFIISLTCSMAYVSLCLNERYIYRNRLKSQPHSYIEIAFLPNFHTELNLKEFSCSDPA